jgi:hypothetical protein
MRTIFDNHDYVALKREMATTRDDLSMEEFQQLFTANRLDTLRVPELKTILRYVQTEKSFPQVKLSGLKPQLLERIKQLIYPDQDALATNDDENEEDPTEETQIMQEPKQQTPTSSTARRKHQPPPVYQHLDPIQMMMYTSYGSLAGSMNPHQYNQMLQQYYQQQDPVMMQNIMAQQQQHMMQQMQQYTLQQQQLQGYGDHLQENQHEEEQIEQVLLPDEQNHTDEEKSVELATSIVGE